MVPVVARKFGLWRDPSLGATFRVAHVLPLSPVLCAASLQWPLLGAFPALCV